MDYLTHRNTVLPRIGFGTYTLGDDEGRRQNEIATMRYGIEHYGMTLIDTAEMYGLGLSEKRVGEIIAPYPRNSLFIVDKILPENAMAGRYVESCRRSLALVGVDYFDLYLLHWREDVDLQDMVDNMEQLVRMGLIRRWGVSNFDVDDMEELFACKGGAHCFCNQILFNLGARGPEYDLIPWCIEHDVLLMAYSPLYNNADDRRRVTDSASVRLVAEREQKTPESLMLSFVAGTAGVITMFKTASMAHLEGNMRNVFRPIDAEDMALLSADFPAPKHKVPLMTI